MTAAPSFSVCLACRSRHRTSEVWDRRCRQPSERGRGSRQPTAVPDRLPAAPQPNANARNNRGGEAASGQSGFGLSLMCSGCGVQIPLSRWQGAGAVAAAVAVVVVRSRMTAVSLPLGTFHGPSSMFHDPSSREAQFDYAPFRATFLFKL